MTVYNPLSFMPQQHYIYFCWSDKLFLFFAVSCHASGIYFLDFVRRITVQVASGRSREHLVQYRRACHHGSRHFRLQHRVRILCAHSPLGLTRQPWEKVIFRDSAMVKALTSHHCGPGSIPGLGVICGLSLLLVLVFAS